MTIAKTASRKQYSGDGATVAFSFPYRFFDDADLNVYLLDASGVETLQTLTTHYTVSNTDTESGGTVTMVTAPASGETLTILREVAFTQSVDYQNNDAFPAETHEDAIDRLTLLVQQLSERLDRALTLTASDAASVDIPYSRASKYLAFDASKNPIAATAPEGGNVVSAFMATVLDDASASDARATLGATGTADLIDETNARRSVLTTGAADAYALAAPSTVTAYASGQVFNVRVHAANTTASTIDVDSLGAKSIKKYDATGSLVALEAGDLRVGDVVQIEYDGTDFFIKNRNLVNPSTSAQNIAGTIDTVFPSVAGAKQVVDVHQTVLQRVRTQTSTYASGTTTIPNDTTKPQQSTEGTEFMTLAVTPQSASSTLHIEVLACVSAPGAGSAEMIGALFEDGTENAIATDRADSHSGGGPFWLVINYSVASGSTLARTYAFNAGRSSGTINFNGDNGAALLDSTIFSSITITEYQ